MKLLIATGNPGKLREYRRLLENLEYEIVGLADIGLADMDVEETGTTFSENAIIKAESYGKASGLLTLADDSGLAVDALEGRPGVYSARYGGGNLDNAGRRAYLLREMQTIPDPERTARFVCVIALHHPETGKTYTTEGTVEGRILHEERDAGKGFGYDPIFQPAGYDLTFGELDDEVKNKISHRGRAAEQVPGVLAALTEEAGEG